MKLFDTENIMLRALGFIKCSILIKKNAIGTEIYLSEHLTPVDYGTHNGTNALEQAVEWCEIQLKTWNGCTGRNKWNSWKFHSEHDADKFITYYNLTCPYCTK